MPANFNALLRYKTIDECLCNPNLECTIDVLISKCNESLREYQNSEASVSERTIRNDIRIMRSNALGFNAPIVVENGVYFYEISDFSIFSSSVKEMDLLIEIQTLLVEEFDNIKNKNISYLLVELAGLTGKKIPRRCAPPGYGILESKSSNANYKVNTYKINLNYYILFDRFEKPKKRFFHFFKKPKELPEPKELLKWQFIFEVIK